MGGTKDAGRWLAYSSLRVYIGLVELGQISTDLKLARLPPLVRYAETHILEFFTRVEASLSRDAAIGLAARSGGYLPAAMGPSLGPSSSQLPDEPTRADRHPPRAQARRGGRALGRGAPRSACREGAPEGPAPGFEHGRAVARGGGACDTPLELDPAPHEHRVVCVCVGGEGGD